MCDESNQTPERNQLLSPCLQVEVQAAGGGADLRSVCEHVLLSVTVTTAKVSFVLEEDELWLRARPRNQLPLPPVHHK